MRKVNNRSRALRHHNTGISVEGYFSKIKLGLRQLFGQKNRSFSVEHSEDRYQGYSLPRPTQSGSLFSMANLKKYLTHGGVISVGVFTIVANTCFGANNNNLYSQTRLAQASANPNEQLTEIDVKSGQTTTPIVNNQTLNQVTSTITNYTAAADKKDQIQQALQNKNAAETEDMALIQDSYLEKTNSPVTAVSDQPRSHIITHIVKDDETLWSIATKYNLTTDTIKWSNDLSGDTVKADQELYIMPLNGVYYAMESGDTIESVAEKYKSKVEDIKKWNTDLDLSNLPIGQKVFLPGGSVPPPPAPVVSNNYSSGSSSGGDSSYYSGPVNGSGSGQFQLPTHEMYISQYFGATSFNPWHTGLDLDSRSGWDIMAADSGTVVEASYGWGGGYGNHIIIDHGNGYKTLYGHLSSLDVSAGDYVTKGQRLGTMGSTGWSTGPHLHFEIRYNGQFLNPLNFLQ
jgi:murein DD-endopeptidase MepM/ murein hydrolase activator NlpD